MCWGPVVGARRQVSGPRPDHLEHLTNSQRRRVAFHYEYFAVVSKITQEMTPL